MKTEKFKAIGAVFLSVVMLMGITACGGVKDDPENGSSAYSSDYSSYDADSTDSDGSDLASSSEQSESQQSSSTASNKPSSSSGTTSSKPQSGTKIFKVESYGAKGDGKTNDGPAIANAVKAAAADSSANKIVQFQANKTYRVTSVPSSNDNNRLFDLQYAENVQIQGSNTTILLKAPVRVGVISQTDGCGMSGFIFDYSPKPFVIGTVIAKGSDYIDFNTTEDFDLNGWTAPETFFAFRNKENERLHFMSTGYKKLGTKKYRLLMKPGSTGQPSQAVIGEEFILPTPGYSHGDGGGGAFSINKNTNFTMSNIRIYSLPEFGFDIRCNEGKMTFKNIVFRPESSSKIHLVCWRDGFHVKDNSAQIIWENCDIGPLGDDAFNISSVCLKPTMINASKDTFTLTPMEGGSVYQGRPSLSVGDEFIAYDNFTGKLIGQGTVKKVISTNPVTFQSSVPLPNVDSDTYFCFYSYANPDYIVRNCKIEGTVRVRCPGTFENCNFNIFWLKIENETYFEGPIPKNITFKNCTFKSISGTGKNIVQIGTRYKNNVSAPAEYKCKNIVFQGCTWVGGTTYSAEPGNEVIVK